MARPLWQLLMLLHDPESTIELSCVECFELLEYDADRLVVGQESDLIRPSVKKHLALCSSCRAQLDEWVEKLAKQKSGS